MFLREFVPPKRCPWVEISHGREAAVFRDKPAVISLEFLMRELLVASQDKTRLFCLEIGGGSDLVHG